MLNAVMDAGMVSKHMKPLATKSLQLDARQVHGAALTVQCVRARALGGTMWSDASGQQVEWKK